MELTLTSLPHIICLQETFLSLKYNPSIPDYNLIRKDRSIGHLHTEKVVEFVCL